MKRIILILGIVMRITASIYGEVGDVFTVDEMMYRVMNSGTEVSICGTTKVGTSFSLTIPTTVTNQGVTYHVTSIGENAFSLCYSWLIGSLTIPNSVTSIGDWAFADCSGLTGSLIIPNSVTSIGENAFLNCSGLIGSLTIPNSVTSIGKSAFWGCSGFTGSLTIPNSMTSIGEYTFYYCSGFTGSLTIPNSVTSIGGYAFWGCSGLTGSLTIPNSVTSIGDWAFAGCSGFTGSLTISNSVTSIGEWVFGDCSGLTGSLTIPNSVTSIGGNAFAGCSGFTGSLTIPNSVTSIGDQAFCMCSGFTGTLTIGNSVTSIGDLAFAGCNGITSILVTNTVPPTIGDNDIFMFPLPPIYILCGYEDTYKQVWTQYTNHIYSSSNILTILSADEQQGVVLFVQHNTCDNNEAVIKAVPKTGHTFEQWSDGNTDNPRTIIVNEDATLSATFRALKEYTITINTNDDLLGTVMDEDGWSAIGTYEYYEGVTITLQARPFDGCVFVQWSDGNTDNPRTFVVDKDSSLTAYFQEIGGSDGGEDEGGDEDNNDDEGDDGNGGDDSSGDDDGSGADTPVENISEDATSTRVWKVLRDGQLLIIRDGEEYSVTGVKIK